MTTIPTASDIAAAIERGKREVLSDIGEGILPHEVATFSALHDYVDANTYAGLCDTDGPDWTVHVDAVNQVQNALDAWIREGGHRADVTVHAHPSGGVVEVSMLEGGGWTAIYWGSPGDYAADNAEGRDPWSERATYSETFNHRRDALESFPVVGVVPLAEVLAAHPVRSTSEAPVREVSLMVRLTVSSRSGLGDLIAALEARLDEFYPDGDAGFLAPDDVRVAAMSPEVAHHIGNALYVGLGNEDALGDAALTVAHRLFHEGQGTLSS